MVQQAPTEVAELIARSNRLGSDRRNTNYAGGNTSAKGTATDPATGQPVELLWVKGSGGDLGTLTPDGLAVLRLDWLGAQRAAVYCVPESELGAFYAQRTLLKREVLPEHVAAAVFVLTAGELPLTTGFHIPVDAGVAAAFLR